MNESLWLKPSGGNQSNVKKNRLHLNTRCKVVSTLNLRKFRGLLRITYTLHALCAHATLDFGAKAYLTPHEALKRLLGTCMSLQTVKPLKQANQAKWTGERMHFQPANDPKRYG